MKYINTDKIEQWKMKKDNTFIVLDFDGTITDFNSADSWKACGEKLGKEFNNKMNDYYNYYAPIEIDYTISKSEKEKYMVEWYSKCMQLYEKHNLTKLKLEESVLESKIKFRKGAKDFLKKMNEWNIPVIILSAGIGNVIEIFLNNNELYLKNMYIVSNFIEFNENGEMKKFDGDMIHTMNKTMKNHLPKELENQIKQKEYGILIGDLISDKKMINKEVIDNVLTIGFLKEEKNLKIYNENFDIVLYEEDANFFNIDKLVSDK